MERDKAIAELTQKFGAMGCGYPTDPQTIAFLENWLRQYGEYPAFVRRSWKPAKKLRQAKTTKQTTF